MRLEPAHMNYGREGPNAFGAFMNGAETLAKTIGTAQTIYSAGRGLLAIGGRLAPLLV